MRAHAKHSTPPRAGSRAAGRPPRLGSRRSRSGGTGARPADPWLAALALLLSGCAGALELTPSDHATVLAHQALHAPNPALPGPNAVTSLFYGSGTDRRRAEYRDSVSILTESVDASTLVDLGDDEEERNRWWGFGPEAFPVNGRVWAPEGGGPFPLVLIVHGNHDMKDFSDPGYAYLGELLASRGFITVSVDENFLNGSIDEENDARGWLLLRHLVAWREFDADPGNPFHGRVDLDRVALIGHSRGGEAVGHAAAFNRLSRYPDDASLEFDFGFGIRAVVAIAPVDGQYLPTGRPVPLENVDYMVFHGSHDGDVTSFHGLRQYSRVRFTDGEPRFKAAIYMYRANHGQWNTVWGSGDRGPRSGRSLDLRGLIDPEAQREFAKLYISAFLEATLHDRSEYLPMFRDHRLIGGWLPETMYVTRFEASSFRPLATFEEDIDVTTGSAPGVRLRGDSLAVWREDLLDLRSRNRPSTSNSQGTNAVWLGWHRSGSDRAPRYVITLPDPPSGADLLRARPTTLDLLLSALDEWPGEHADDDRTSHVEPGDVDLSVEVVDDAGRSYRVPLSDYGPIRPPLHAEVLRRNDEEAFDAQSEVILQSYSIPLTDFTGVDRGALREISLVFDRTDAGTVVVDEIGLSALDPAFFVDPPAAADR